MSVTSGSALDYRADIDGLRALAVIAVLLFHGGFKAFQGGFTGVDVFFVISGYLITKIILKDLNSARFSLAGFYERRARRIIPALTVTIALSVVGAYFLLTPRPFEDAGQSVVAVSVFSSNFLFWKEADYFDLSASLKPLLHTWSLGVEEQFYLAFPLLMLGISRSLPTRIGLSLSLLTVISLVASVVTTFAAPEAAFYLAPLRAWELLVGAILAAGVVPPLPAWACNPIAALGLAFVAGSAVLFGPDTPFPGFAAVLPVLGAACVVHAGSSAQTPVGRLLSSRPLVFVGLISYSLYLLHWPILVFARQLAIVELSTLETIGLLLVATAMAAVSWRFIERPLRSRARFSRRQIFTFAACASTVAIATGTLIDLAEGAPGRSTAFALADESPEDFARRARFESCRGRMPLTAPDSCRLGPRTGEPAFVVWGDSHAQALAVAVDHSAAQHNVTGVLTFQGSCRPLHGIASSVSAACSRFSDKALNEILHQPKLRAVILAAMWPMSADGRAYKMEGLSADRLTDIEHPENNPGNARLFEEGLTRTVHQLLAAGRNVALVDTVPEVGYDVPSAYFIALRTGRNVSDLIASSRQEYESRNRGVQPVFAALAKIPGVRIISVSARMCGTDTCAIIDPNSGKALYRDGHHLSGYGSLRVSSLFDELFEIGESMNRLYSFVDHALRALILLLGTWAIYAQVAVLARIPFTTLRLFSFLPLLATAFLLRVTARRVEPCDAIPMSGQAVQSSWFASPILRFGGPLAAAVLFFFTKSEWLFWIAAAAVLTAEVWFAPVSPDASEHRTLTSPSTSSSRLEAVGLICLCAIAAAATAGLMRPDIDDAYYVNVATSVNEFPDRAPLSFDAMHRDGLPPVEQALHLPQSYEVLVGLLSSVTAFSVPTLYYLFFPSFWAVLGTLAHWLVLRTLLPRREAILATAIWIFIVIFWGDGLRAFGSFGFARIFQGKAIFLVVLAPLIVLAGLRYRRRPGLSTWICLALSESAAFSLTTNAIVIAPLLAAFAIAAQPRFDRSYLRALAGGAAASLPLMVVAVLMHARLSPFLTAEDPDPYSRPFLTTLGYTRAPLALLAITVLPVLAARARLAWAEWIRSYVWLVVILVFVPAASAVATLALGNVFSWRIFWSVPAPLLVSLAGGIAAGALLDRRWLPEGAVVGWLIAFALVAPPTFALGGWSIHNFGRLKVVEPAYLAAQATVALARTEAPALVTEAVSMYSVGMPGGPPLVGVRRLYLRKLWHLIPDAELARRLQLSAYVARGDRAMALGSELEAITRRVGGDPFLPFDAAIEGIDAGRIATVVFREDHPDLPKLLSALGDRGFTIHHVSGYVVAALPK